MYNAAKINRAVKLCPISGVIMAFNNVYCNTRDIKPDSKGEKKKRFLETQNKVVHWIYNISEQTKTADELIRLIVEKVEAKPIFYKHVNDICKHLDQVMKFFYRQPNVEIKLFGSALTKLALEESDVDIFLDFGGTLPEPPEKLLRTLKNKVRKFGYFTRCIPIFARAPIVQCVHRSGISCDFSFTCGLSISRSNLIKFFISLDNRIRPLILILKFLFKKHGLLGQNGIPSFGLVVLTVFFLQQIQDPLIPSVSFLQNLAERREIIGDWDVSFTTYTSLLPKTNNQLSVAELLKNFFEFYATFEFGFYVISPFTGKSYLKSMFSDPKNLPEEFNLYKENFANEKSCKFDYNKAMCVQCFFNQSDNVAKNVTEKAVEQFQKLCHTNVALGKELLDKDATDENKLKYIVKLFDLEVDDVKNKNSKTNSVSISVGPNLKFSNNNCSEGDLRKEWSQNIFNSVKDVLIKIMKCNIDSSVPESESANFVNEKTIKCEFHYPELIQKWRNECRNEFEFPSELGTLEREEIISNYICDTIIKDAKKQCLKFEITCTVCQGPTCFVINFECSEIEKSNRPLIEQVFQFIKKNFPKWIN